MNRDIANRLTRIARYFDRLRTDLKNSDCPQAMADSAELTYQAQKCYDAIKQFYAENRAAAPVETAAQNKTLSP